MSEAPPPNRIRELREARGQSLREFAPLVGIDFNVLGRLERGDTPLDYPRMQKIARVMGVKVSELLLDEDVELRADEAGQQILRELREIPPQQLPIFLTTAKQVLSTARSLAAQQSAAALGGTPRQVGQLADMWAHWDDGTREKALRMLQVLD